MCDHPALCAAAADRHSLLPYATDGCALLFEMACKELAALHAVQYMRLQQQQRH